MNAFVNELLNLNKAISALYIVLSSLVTIGITLSLMLHFDFGLFYNSYVDSNLFDRFSKKSSL
jgi:hypothetical protein